MKFLLADPWESLSTITERLSSSCPLRAASQSIVVSIANPPSTLHDPTIISASDADNTAGITGCSISAPQSISAS